MSPPVGSARSGVIGARAVDVIPDSVVDNFEVALYEDQGRSLSDVYGGDLSAFSRQQTVVYNGSYALLGDGEGTINDVDGSLSGYPQQGETFRAWVRPEDNVNYSGFGWAVQNEEGTRNGYYALISIQNSSFSVYQYDTDGTINQLSEPSQTYSTGSWYEIVVEWLINGDITATLNDDTGSQLNQINVNDLTFSSGGVGWFVSGGQVALDQYEVV